MNNSSNKNKELKNKVKLLISNEESLRAKKNLLSYYFNLSEESKETESK